jgi:hypothetical protein
VNGRDGVLHPMGPSYGLMQHGLSPKEPLRLERGMVLVSYSGRLDRWRSPEVTSDLRNNSTRATLDM